MVQRSVGEQAMHCLVLPARTPTRPARLRGWTTGMADTNTVRERHRGTQCGTATARYNHCRLASCRRMRAFTHSRRRHLTEGWAGPQVSRGLVLAGLLHRVSWSCTRPSVSLTLPTVDEALTSVPDDNDEASVGN